uniref:Spectrin repeat containing nuclear envelope protein 2 n=1 Tax=Saimiri boliviensis boliviensis TaxID=39432 RepID=A0A2K6TJ47_SAIBB
MASSPELPTEDEQVSWGIDDLHISLQAEQEDTQKKTFTCWVNSQLARHTSPSVISDLFKDIKKGHVLLDLLEVLSGQQLPRDKGSNTFQCRINIEHALTFLRNRSIKLINIHVTDIIDGNPSIILGLIWTIILHFHIEKLAQTLSCNYNQPSLDDVSVVDSSPTSSPPAKKCSKVQARWQMSAKKALLLWAQQQCATYESVNVTDFKSSWRNGMAFLAIIHALRPDLIDMKSVKHRSNKDNLREAFRIAERELKIPRLLEPEDVDVVDPDEKSIMTYVAQFLQYSKDAHGTGEEARGKVKNAMVWLTLQKEKLQKLLKDSENDTYFQKYNSLLSFMESFSEEKESFLDVLSTKRNLDEPDKDQLQLEEAWDGLNHQINAWTVKLNCALPPPLHQTEAWLQEVEGLMGEDLSTSQDYSQDTTLIQEKMTLFKSLMDRFEYHSNNLLTFENRDENHLPLVPPDKLEEMKRRVNNILEKKFILLLEFHYYKCLVLGLLDEVKSKLDIWNIKYGSRESVELLLEDWHKFIEEKGFLAQLDTSFQKCEEIYKHLAGECQNISKQYMAMKSDVCMCRKNIYSMKSTLQTVLAYWATYVENLRLLRACFEETKKEEIKEVPFETLAQWNLEHGTFNEAGNFLIEVSNDVVGSSISKELRRLNKRWRKFFSKTQLEMNLPLIKKQDQPTFDNSGNIQLSKEEKSIVEFSTDLSVELPENYNQNIKAGEEHEKENEESTGQLKVAKNVEKVIGQVEIWEAETKSLLDLLRDHDDMNTSMEESLKHLIAKGSMYEELMARTEDMLHVDIQNFSSQESFQHVLTTGLQAKIQAAKEKVQISVVKLVAALKNSTDVSPELDVRLKMEESQKELESYMTRAQQLLGQRESPGGLISKYKEALIISNTESLAKYLKAVEELKNHVTEDIKMSLEEKRRDICATWESLHHELSLYVQQLKIDIEKGKLSDNILKLEKQINKEKKLIRRGRTKGLIKEHEACFSEEGCLYQLNHHVEVLRELCEELPSQKSQQEVKRLLKDYEQKIERLLKCASEIHTTLQATAGGTSGNERTVTTSENKGGDSHSEVLFAKSDNQPSAEKAMEPVRNFSLASELKPPQEESIMEKDYSASINSLLERYDTYRDNLEHHLQNSEFRVTSDFSSGEDRSSSCLQAKLTDLQVLKNETDAYWKEFEIISLKLENLANDMKKPFIVKERGRLKEREQELQMTLNTRMQSLETARQLVLPVEKAALLLCGSDMLLHKMAIQEFGLVNADGIYQHLRNIQYSIAKQIEICNRLEEPGNYVLKELHPCDLHAMQNIVLKYKTQFEEMNRRVQRSEDTLRALEGFLESLKTVKLSAEPVIDLSASDTQVAQENALTVKNTGHIHLLKDKARHLDKCLKMLDMSFKDAEQGEGTSCENLVDALSVKLSETHGCGVQENTLLEACIFKNNELLKNIQDVQSQISKIGLKDPTVPAVKHRKKSLIRLDKDLDEYEEEKKHLQEMANSLPHCKDGREKAVSQQCQNTVLLWENTKAFITECLEQCGRVLELLKQYQNFKGILTTLIQKEESVISLQASYMGKENLKKRIAEIEIVKEEFNEHLEVVDKINQICKNLQFHLNKMKTFEEPPFEKEANIIVDRWLDVNEKTEDYYESLGRALALWDKLFNLKNVIDEWTEKALQKMELHQLTEEDRERLKEELQVHEQKASEFSRRVAEIQFLLQSSEIPLELQVMESSILSKMEHVQKCLTGESNSYALSGSTAELREDLDQAKTQIGMTESLLKALSPSDSLEIFTKLEEIQQQILQQKHSMILLENQIGCLTPELSELKKQYESVSDLFNTKKSVLQDHFSKLLNDQCKNFNDWFSNIKMNLKECFESSETKRSVEQKLQKLSDFLTLEGRNSKIQQVDSVLKRVKKHLPKAHVKELSSWLVGQEFELEKMESICQARAKELEDYLEHLLRLQDDHRNLSKWLMNQEEKWKGMEESGEKTELFYHGLARKREQFESVAQLNNSLKEFGFTEEEEIIMESTCLMDRYQTLLRQLSEIEEEDKLPPMEDQSFNDLAHDVIHWIKEIKESLMVLNSSEGKMPLEERIQKIKEIILLKPEGDARIETIMKQAESSEAPLVQKTLTDISNQWENTLHLASTYLSHQEKLLLEGEKYLQSKEDLRLMLIELKKKQEAGFALQHGLQEKKAQLKIYKKFLKKAQDLTSLLKELKSQGNYLLECTKNPSFSEEPWLEIKHLHESLLQQLQDSVQNLEGHVREHDSYQVCVTDLNTTLDNFSKEFISFSDKPVDQIAVEEKLQKLQELENRLSLQDGTLKKILALAKSVKRNTSSVGQKIIKDSIKSLKYKQKDLENRLESAKQEMEYCLNSILKSKCSSEKKEKFTLPGTEKQATSDVRDSTQESAAMEKLEEVWEINMNFVESVIAVFKTCRHSKYVFESIAKNFISDEFQDSAVETVMSKQLSLNVQESMKNTEDEQKVNELQNQPLELDIMLRNEQLEEIKELYTQLEAKKAALEPLEQTECLNKTETGALGLHNAGYSAQHLDNLLQALTTLKKNKESQYCLLRDFQEHLAAVESSVKALLTDKESLKVGPLDSVTYLDKIKTFIATVEKEKDSLGNLKIKWENLSNHVTDMDKKLLESQIKQLEHGWEQVEQQIQKKYSQQVVKYGEFTSLMNKIRDTEISLQQQQQHLQLRLKSPEEQAGNRSMIALTTDLQAAKHGFSILKGQAEFQMKRIWGEKEKKILEDEISNLKKQWESLDPLNLEAENQIKKCDIRNKMKETILWAKNLLGELIPSISLLPDDILSQIRKCKVTHDAILDRQQAVESLAKEVRDKVPSLTTCEGSDLNNTLEDLQNQYQTLVLKSTQRSQRLEFKLEERSNFFAIIRKFQLMAQESETLITPKVETAATEAELKHHHVTLKASQRELQEIDSVISTYLQELTNIYEELNVFERLFLDDQLKNLKNRTSRTQRLIQNKCNEVEHKINFCREFHEKTLALQEEVDSIQHNEPLLNQEVNTGVKEEIYNLKDRLTAIKCSILQVLKLKKVFDFIGLNWDFSQLDQLQTVVFEKEKELEEKVKQLDTFEEEHGKYQALLSEMRAIDLQIKKMTEVVLKAPVSSPESRLLNAQILSQRIEKAKCLCEEIIKKLNDNMVFDDSFKEKEILQIKLNAEENGKLYRVLQNMILDLPPKEMDEKHFQDKLETSFHVLNQIKSQLQQPLLINLEIKHIQNEKDNCKAFQEQVWAEVCSIRAVTAIEKQREENSLEASDVETKLRDFEDLQMQLTTSVDLRINVLNDACENLTRYKEAVTRAVESITSLEAIVVHYRIDIGNPEESLEMPLRKQEELESTIADIQDLTEKLGMISSPEAKLQLQCTLQELVSKNSAMKEAVKVQETEAERYLENYKCCRKTEEDIYTNLSKIETVLGQSMSSLPLSYREALEHLEQSKALVSNLISTKEELIKLRQILRLLRLRCTENDGICLLKIMSALWEKWLSLLEAAQEWEMWCEELKQEWKFVSEEIEREAIILDNLQEELPEISKTKEAATTEELSELLDCLCQYGENMEKQQLLLTLLLQRIRRIQNVPEGSGTVETVPAFQEITSMQERCNQLLQKAQKNKELVQTEIQERHSFTKEIIGLKNLFQQTSTSFQNMAFQDHPEKAEQVEELQGILKKGKLTFENIMEKLRIKYSEMYTIVPAEIESQMEECRKALEDIDEKISNEVLKSSPSHAMRRKIEEINNGLHNVEKMLQQKSKNIEKAQEIQKKMWDELDLWHSKLNELDSEVQDIVEQDPGQAQEWMDNLMIPFQQYQQVSQRAESRTSQLNKATVKMEEYSDLLKSTEAWIENTSRLLASPADYDSSKTLSHHASTLQMALEDAEQKHSLLHSILMDLEDLSIIVETDELTQSVQELSNQVTALQQKVMKNLPQIQQMADDVVAIESEVKSMEKRVSKIKTILLSKEILDFSPEEHLKHGEVILENIRPMKKTIAEILSYQVGLRLPQTGMKPLPVFQRTNQLSQDIKLLENVTQEQNELLKVIIKQTNECDEEIENLKQILNNHSAQFSFEHMSPDQAAKLPQLQEEIEGMEKQILSLNQKKEDLLVDLKATILNLHQHLKQEEEKAERDVLPAVASEEGRVAERDASEWQLNRRGSMSYLAAVEEEAEESSVKSEHDKDEEEDRASSSSGTIVQEAYGKISTCDNSMAQILAPDSPNTEQGSQCSLRTNQTEEGTTPPIKVATLDSSDTQGGSEPRVEKTRPEAAEVLHACKTQVAELELWLQQANVAFEPETLNADMQQVVEQQLVGCQAMLTEIEHKVAFLLEACKDQGLGDNGATQYEAEALSLKLKTVKCNLEKVQMMLQEKHIEDQHPTILKRSEPEHQKVRQPVNLSELESTVTERPQFSRQKDFQQQQVQELKPMEQKDFIKFIEFNAKKMWPQYCQHDKATTQESSARYPTTEELKTYTTQLEDLRQEASNLQAQENGTEEMYVNLDKKLFELFLTLSQCLSSVEEMLQMTGLYREDGSDRQVHYETLALELKKLYLALSDKKDDLLKAMTWPGRNTNLLLECFDNLQVCLEHTQAAAAFRSKSLKAGLDYNHSFQKADAHTVELENSESRVAKLRDEGERLHLPYVLLQEIYKLEEVLDGMWGILRARYAELSGPVVTESQQDALLQGVVELVKIGKEKLAYDHLKQTKSKVALQAQIENHKVFFQKLVADMLLIQTYSAKILPSLLQKRETFWAEQVTEVKILEEKSHQRGMKLQSLLQKWEEFDENYASLEKDLEILLSTLPSVSLVEETEERLVERISFYQQIKRNIGGKHARLYQTLNEGKQLVASVSCPELEGQIAKLEEQWLSLNKKIDHELHRLQTLVKHLLRSAFLGVDCYNRDSDQLTKWLESSQHTLNYWKEQSLNVSQDLYTIRSNINNFFEFSKEVDEKSSLKTAVISTGNQLLHLKETDTATLRASLAQFEQKWTMLITQLPDIQEKLHQLQMEKLPSRKAITEMISWMNNVEHQTSDEDSVHSPSSASQVKHLLQKHKEFRMEMDYKQWIVDFVNQSLLQLSTCDVESKRYERTEFAEHLGEMNRQWHRVHGMLNRKIQHLEQLLESITESENKIQILNNWMEAQEERLKTLQKPESVISVQKLLLDCQDIENQLAIKSKALDELKQSYLTLESGGMPLLEDTASRIDGLFQKRSSAITQINQLKISMQSVLQEWKIYDQLYDEVNMMTIRFWYCVEHSKPVVLSLEALRCQVENLQSLQDEAESSEGSWEKLQEVIGKLKGLCPSVAEIIEEKCQDTHKRWTEVNQAIADHLQKAQSLLQLWKAYSSAHAEAAARLKQQEAKFQQLANISMSGNNLAEILPPALQDIKELQNDVQKTKEAFLQNSTVLDRLPQPTESSTHMLLPGPLHFLQRTSYLEKMLLVKANEFENHVLALTAQSPDIEHLNEVSLKLPLSDIAVKTLQNMNRQWIRATATALERCSELQGIGLNEKFLYCCEKWTQLLEKIEEALQVDVANSLPELLEQQKTYEMLEAEVSINQTIADSYVTQSLQLLDTAEIENRPEFISEFSKLTDRWQNAVQGVRQRKSDIDGLNAHVARCGGESLKKQGLSYSLHTACGWPCSAGANKKIHFQRWRTTYALTLEAGEKLLLTANLETKESMGRRISQLQDNWNDTEAPLAEMIQQFQSTVETWDQCEKKIKELKSRLQVLKAQSEDPLPELHEDLHHEKELIKVAIRKQEIEDRLNSWIVFNEKNKELCAWLVQMENKVLQTADISIEEMIEKLQKRTVRREKVPKRWDYETTVSGHGTEKSCFLSVRKFGQGRGFVFWCLCQDCMEEINLFSENKLQLKQMGDQLIKASNKSRAAEIDDKLNKVNDRWQHLFDVIGSSSKMSCLQIPSLKTNSKWMFFQWPPGTQRILTWPWDRLCSCVSTGHTGSFCSSVSRCFEHTSNLEYTGEPISCPIIHPHGPVQCLQVGEPLRQKWVKKLKETFAFIQQLDKNMSNLRTWLARIESELSKPVVYDVCNDQEIQKRLAEQQDLQRDIEQHSAGVESVFNICDVLLHDSDACANETECDSIQQTTRSLDRRWRNICAMSMERRMKIEETWRLWQKFLDDYSRFEDWLKSAERTAACPNSSEVLYTSAKEELKRFERQIHERLTQLELINKQYRRLARENRTDTASRLKQMVHEGNQRWDNLQRRVTAVLRRLRHFTNQREEFEGTRESILVWLTEMDLQLTNVEHFSESDADDKMRQLNVRATSLALLKRTHAGGGELGLEDEKEASENETDMEDPREIQTDSWRKRGESEEPSSPQSLCHLVPPAPGHERSGCETPVSVDSIPLEWDHTGDVGGSSSHEEDEEGPYYSALSGKSISDGHSWHVPDSPSCPKHHYKQTEGDGNVPPVPAESSTAYNPPYVSLDSTGNIACVCAFDRWELIQAQELHKKLKIKQNLQQLNSDISTITAWLKKTKAELETLKMAKPPSNIQEIELRVKRLKEILKAFDTYKASVISVNVSSKEFLQTENAESTELQSRLRQLSLLWEATQGMVDSCRGGLRQSLMQCQDFHHLSQNLLLWLASAENRRQKAHVAHPKADPQALLECQRELMQLEKELVECQPRVDLLQEISNSLLIKGHGEEYIEAEEKVHVTEKKLKQLREQVSQDLMSLQGTQNPDSPLPGFDEVDSGDQPLSASMPAPRAKFLYPAVQRENDRRRGGDREQGRRQHTATALLPLTGDPGSPAPAAASPAAAAPGLPAALLRRRLQLHSSQQLCQVLLPHAEVHQRATPHIEGVAGCSVTPPT